jgi:two-component system, cell cycle sensor histidine kinase and response regulator CckA
LIGSVELLKLQISRGQDTGSNIERLESVSRKMQDLTFKLVAYAEGGKYLMEKVPVDALVGKGLNGAPKSLDIGIEVELSVPADTYFVNVDRTQMEMALSGIVTNAFEALDNGGLVVISAQKTSIRDSLPEAEANLAEGEYVELRIMDTGRGMDPQTKDQIFNPFFSTKFAGRGLSLAAAYGIVKNHGGAIEIESEIGKGTTVKIYLPLAS